MLKTVFITKFAPTKGIIECEMELSSTIIKATGIVPSTMCSNSYYSNDFQETKQRAIIQATNKVNAKIHSLEFQIQKLKRIKFV